MTIVQETHRLTRALLQEQRGPLFILFVVGLILSLTLTDAIADLPRSQESARLTLQLTLGIWEMLEGVLLFLILSWGIPAVHAMSGAHFQQKPFSTPYLSSFFAEYLRLLAQSIYWALLIILPGIWRYSRLIFMPYIALFARPYREGKYDAVQLALRLTSARRWEILGVVAGTLALSTAIEILPNMYADLHILPVRVLSFAISFVVMVWSYCFVFAAFAEAMENHSWN